MMKIKRHDRVLCRFVDPQDLPKYYDRLSPEDLVDRLPCGCDRESGEFSIDEIYELARAGDEKAKELVREFEEADDGEFGSLVDEDGRKSRFPRI
jgi:hypothetical protein